LVVVQAKKKTVATTMNSFAKFIMFIFLIMEF